MSRSKFYFVTSVLVLLGITISARSQQYDLLLRNGHVIDAKNSINTKMDVAVAGGKIARVAPFIPSTSAKKTIDVRGMYVSPGFIDIHTHVFVGSAAGKFADGSNSVSPDDFTLRNGVTTVVDAGTSGWKNFPVFKENVIDKSKTRILAWLNIAANGMTGKPLEEDTSQMDVQQALQTLKQYPDVIAGVKIGHYEGTDWIPFDRALQASEAAGKPLFVECHLPQYSLEDQLKKMRKGDIITHSFENVSERMPVTDSLGKLHPFVKNARDRGVLFDLGHGGAGFWFSVAMPAMKNGLPPHTFGTDLHRFSINAGMKDMMNVMSKYMAMGMSLPDVVLRATWNAADAINREDLGNFSEGSAADIAVFTIRKGKFGYVDAGGNVIYAEKKLENELTIIDGKIVFDLNGLSANPYKQIKE